jgi:Mg2+ and Co2+ transporter CorA
VWAVFSGKELRAAHLYRSGTGHVTIDLPATDWCTALHDQTGVLWVDFSAAPLVAVEPHLRDTFGFHVLAIDDALRESMCQKLMTGRLSLRSGPWRNIRPKSLALTTRELDIFLAGTIVTHHRQSIDAERVWRHVCSEHRRLEHARLPTVLLLDTLTADYMPTIDALDTTLDALEISVFTRLTPHTLSTIFAVKRAACISGASLARSAKCSTSWHATSIKSSILRIACTFATCTITWYGW